MGIISQNEALELEARAFDKQIDERLAAGHLPDLRRAGECTWFYNNSWRHPHYIQLDFGEQIELICSAIRQFAPTVNEKTEILEVGCGPGHMALELARNGFNVTGIDLSQKCIETAKRFAAEDPWKETRAVLQYKHADFLNKTTFSKNSFDVVVFIGALHHFPEQQAVLSQVVRVLRKKGLILVHEPTRDRMTKGNAAFIHLVRLLLSQGNGFFTEHAIPESSAKYRSEIEKIFAEMKYESSSGEKQQSVNDNEAGFTDMREALQENFMELHFEERYAFFHELIGGLRFDQKKNNMLASYLRTADKELCHLGVLQPTEFFYVGLKRDGQ
jgi:2-polyprenyl-6-hydroxyphenyl methylase/3-demethylubiquinone-9 3-methyltransferase